MCSRVVEYYLLHTKILTKTKIQLIIQLHVSVYFYFKNQKEPEKCNRKPKDYTQRVFLFSSFFEKLQEQCWCQESVKKQEKREFQRPQENFPLGLLKTCFHSTVAFLMRAVKSGSRKGMFQKYTVNICSQEFRFCLGNFSFYGM